MNRDAIVSSFLLLERSAENEAEEQTGQQQKHRASADDETEEERIEEYHAQFLGGAEKGPQPQGYHDAEGQRRTERQGLMAAAHS